MKITLHHTAGTSETGTMEKCRKTPQKNNKNPQFTYSKIWQSLKQRNSSSILDNA